MAPLTATMVVDLKDRTGNSTRAIIGNLDRLKRAERDRMLAERGTSLNRVQRAQEREMIARQAAAEEAARKRSASMALWATRGTLAAGAVAIAAGRSYATFADLERRVNRIVINADKSAEAIRPTISNLQKVAADTHTSFGEVVSGFETLIASGRSLDESLAFLPSVALTAQASGAAMADIALSADALAGSLNINSAEMQKAFDILVAGGKAGKFELKDMSQYLPSLLPAFSALGYEGTEGLQKIVAMLQVMRNQAGSSSEAATYLGNVLNKMYSEETAKKFSKFGVDLPKALDKAKREGRDVFEVFLDMTQLAIKGDLSKLTRLFTDSEMQKGVRALITQRDVLRQLEGALGRVDGSALKDFNQIAEDSASKIQTLINLWDRFSTQVGAGVATVANPLLEAATTAIDERTAIQQAIEKLGGEQEAQKDRLAFHQQHQRQNPDAWGWDRDGAWQDALIKYGRGETQSVFDGLDQEDDRRRQRERYLSDDKPAASTGGPARHRRQVIPVPTRNPRSLTEQERIEEERTEYERLNRRFPSRGQYDSVAVEQERQLRALQQERRQRPLADMHMPAVVEKREGHWPEPLRDGAERDPKPQTSTLWERLERLLYGKAADPNFDAREHFGITRGGSKDRPDAAARGTTDTLTGKRADDLALPQSVTLSGTPTVALSGMPTVTIANPPPRPNVTINMPVTINEASNAPAVAQQLGQLVQQEMNGAQFSTDYSGL